MVAGHLGGRTYCSVKLAAAEGLSQQNVRDCAKLPASNHKLGLKLDTVASRLAYIYTVMIYLCTFA